MDGTTHPVNCSDDFGGVYGTIHIVNDSYDFGGARENVGVNLRLQQAHKKSP